MEHGCWKTKEDTCEVFSNDDIIGWRTTLEFFKGQAPHEHKTDWVMQVFSATQKRLCDDNEKKVTLLKVKSPTSLLVNMFVLFQLSTEPASRY